MFHVVMLVIGFLLGALVFKLGRDSDWNTVGTLLAALVPAALCYYMGVIGLLVAAAYVGALWKAAAA